MFPNFSQKKEKNLGHGSLQKDLKNKETKFEGCRPTCYGYWEIHIQNIIFKNWVFLTYQWEWVSLGSFPPYRQLGSFSREKQVDVISLSREQVWTFSVLGDRIYEMRCLFVAVRFNARFIVLPHWDNMSKAHMLTHPVTLYWHRADQLCFVVPTSS